MSNLLLTPLDGSECAWAAYDIALQLAWVNGYRLFACTIADPHRLEGEYPQAASSAGALVAQVRVDAHQIVAQAAEKATVRGVQCETQVLFADHPADAIVSVACERSASAIVMGTHGRRGFARTVLGSVAEHVLRTAPCSVVTVRPSR